MRFASLVVLACALAAGGCGSKTGLLVPDLGPDVVDAVDVRDVPLDIFEACVPGTFALYRVNADVMLVIDRSGSMSWNLAGQPMMPPSRWDLLHGALMQTLPPIQNNVALGAIFFPVVVRDPTDINMACGAPLAADVLPARGNADRILNIFNTTMPFGGTPTAHALGVAQQVLSIHSQPGDVQYIVLATDGAPNCNPEVPMAGCVCTAPPDPMTGVSPCSDPMNGSYNCLDSMRTLQVIQGIAASGVPVYVIGIADMGDPTFIDVLNRMAVAGGRPNLAGPESYYGVRQPMDLLRAFQTISASIAQCAFRTQSAPDDPNAIRILLNGAAVARDPTHASGWDWTDLAAHQITFFGAACDSIVANPNATVTAQVGCNDH